MGRKPTKALSYKRRSRSVGRGGDPKTRRTLAQVIPPLFVGLDEAASRYRRSARIRIKSGYLYLTWREGRTVKTVYLGKPAAEFLSYTRAAGASSSARPRVGQKSRSRRPGAQERATLASAPRRLTARAAERDPRSSPHASYWQGGVGSRSVSRGAERAGPPVGTE